ncbi:MAG: radical SAM protein [Candidatus Izemoplasmataceae bacterium]
MDIEAKSIVLPNKTFNLYKGCSHGCIYCDSRSLCYQIDQFEQVKVKKDAVTILSKELASKQIKAILKTGGMSDPYVHIEKQLEITKKSLEIIYHYGFGINVLTKSNMILRDLKLYEKINKRHKAIVQMTITTTDDYLAKLIEPNVTLPSDRLKTLKIFSDSGITTGIWMTPLLPYINDTKVNITSIIKAASKANVKFIIVFGFGTTLREGSREYFYQALDEKFPGYRKLYEKTYKNQYICDSPKALELKRHFEETCELYNIIYKHDEISELCAHKPYIQQTLL